MGKKDKNKSKIKRLKKEEIKQRIITFFSEEATRSHNYKQVSHVIGAKTEVQKQMVCEILESLKDDDYLIEIVPGKYKFNNRGTSSVEGIFERRSNGKNHVITEDEGDPIFIAERNSLRAMNGDKVKVLIYAKRKNHVLEKKRRKFLSEPLKSKSILLFYLLTIKYWQMIFLSPKKN